MYLVSVDPIHGSLIPEKNVCKLVEMFSMLKIQNMWCSMKIIQKIRTRKVRTIITSRTTDLYNSYFRFFLEQLQNLEYEVFYEKDKKKHSK